MNGLAVGRSLKRTSEIDDTSQSRTTSGTLISSIASRSMPVVLNFNVLSSRSYSSVAVKLIYDRNHAVTS